jgi:tRNA pseudouridine38-40 synthase
MRNIKLVIEYDGTAFLGWQSQAEGRTVQSEITRVLDQVLQEHVNLIGAGRTDAGVHAKGQVANFRTASQMECRVIQNALNGLLPGDLVIHSSKMFVNLSMRGMTHASASIATTFPFAQLRSDGSINGT